MNIYQTLWDNDENKFSVSKKLNSGEYENPNADLLIDEQIKADGRRDTDLAKNPLFSFVNLAKLETEINSKFINLLNNYIINYRDVEDYTTQELDEIYQFIETIKSTKVFQLAIDYIENSLNERIQENFNDQMFDIWFKFYTNWFNGRQTDFCSGFEHVFVGEGKYSPTTGGNNTLGEIDGYHNWIKFLLDEKTGRVNFSGYNYGLDNNQGPDNVNVVTLQMTWEHRDLNGDLIAQLFKPKGGFFVGNSPECDLAMGTIAYFESKKGMFSSNDKKQVDLGKSKLALVMYRNINRDATRGDHIRSFYPEYLGSMAFADSLLQNIKGLDYDKSNLLRLNNTLYADFVYRSKESILERSIYYDNNRWKLKFENWK
ncbi:hypothetical protein ACM55F_15555 [Flavobacterium sp. XS2P12]|uniref:hypothetical protein n=1 Tax=Flavobacterium melibiosi TaxID=3398734 RepID=UPI003A8B97B0